MAIELAMQFGEMAVAVRSIKKYSPGHDLRPPGTPPRSENRQKSNYFVVVVDDKQRVS